MAGVCLFWFFRPDFLVSLDPRSSIVFFFFCLISPLTLWVRGALECYSYTLTAYSPVPCLFLFRDKHLLFFFFLAYSSSSSSSSSLSNRSRSHSSNRLFSPSSSSFSLGLRPISVAFKKSRIGLIALGVLNSLFFGLSSLILGRSIFSRARSLYSALLCFIYFLHSKIRWFISCLAALHHQYFSESDFLIRYR